MAGAPLDVGDHLEEVIRRRAEAGEYGPGAGDEIFCQQMAFDVTRPQQRKRRRPNGMTIDIRTTPLPDGGYISVVTDITPLTEAEAQISRRAEDMAVMLSSIRHGVVLWGPDQRLLASNAIAAELLQHPPGAAHAGPDSTSRSWRACWRAVISGPTTGRVERAQLLAELDRSKTYQRQIFTLAGRVLEARSDPTPAGGWVSTFTDVTEARAAQDELRRAKEAAEAANQAKSRFLATMSHELRTPLNAVIGFSDALLHEAARPTRERVAEFATQINDAGRQLLDLINIILDVARIELGRFDLASDRVDVARLVRNCVRQGDAAAQAAEISLAADVPDDLPTAPGGREAAAAGDQPPAVQCGEVHRAGRHDCRSARHWSRMGGCCCTCATPASASRKPTSSACSSRSPSSTARWRGASRAPASGSTCRVRWSTDMAASCRCTARRARGRRPRSACRPSG